MLLWFIGVEIGSLGVSGCDICESRIQGQWSKAVVDHHESWALVGEEVLEACVGC